MSYFEMLHVLMGNFGIISKFRPELYKKIRLRYMTLDSNPKMYILYKYKEVFFGGQKYCCVDKNKIGMNRQEG